MADEKKDSVRFKSAAEVELVRKAVRRADRAPVTCYRAWFLIAAGATQEAAELFAGALPRNARDERLATTRERGGTAIQVRLTAQEWALIGPEVERTGLSFAAWARLVMLSVAGDDCGAQLVAQLRRLGTERAA